MTNQEYAETLRISTSDEASSLPAGRYVLGDPCYSVSDPVWLKIVDALDDLRSGQLTIVLPDNQSYTGLFFSPYDGDGVYPIRSTDDALPVDSGLLALLPTAALDVIGVYPEKYAGLTVTVEGDSMITTEENDGYFVIHANDDYAVSLGNY